MTTTTKTAATTIELERCEGRTVECITETVRAAEGAADVFAQANAMLLRWSRTAPKGGGYHKCAFVVTYADGETYSGRYDLDGDSFPDLVEHMRRHVEGSAGIWCPPHTTPERWAAYLADIVGPVKQAAYKRFLETYAIG